MRLKFGAILIPAKDGDGLALNLSKHNSMKQKIFFLLFCLASFRASAQTIVDPADFPVMSSPTLSNWAIYTREDHVNRKVLPTAIRALMLPIVRQPADITYTPAATGNANDKGSFVKTPLGRIYFIDGMGNSIQTNFPYAAATIADNDVHAGVMCVPVGGWYRLSNSNTLGLPPGTLRQRVFGSATPCTNAANPISPGQTAVVGGSGVLKVNGDPDTNPYVKAQGQHYESSIAYDTLHKKVYTYDFAGSVGNRWNVFEGVSVDTRVDTAYIQNDTLKMLVLDVGEDTIQKTINVALVFPTVTETGLVSPLPSVGRPGSVVIKTIDINNNVALYFSDGSDWLGPFEIPGVKNVDSTMLGPKQVYGLHLAQSGATTGQVYKWNGTNWAPANESSVLVIQEEGTDLTLRQKLNFVGSAATASDDSGNGRTNVTFDSDVNGLASNSNSGIIVRTSAGNFTGRTLSGSEGITLTNANGVSGDPTISPANDLLALEMLNNPGVPYRTGSDTWSITPANFSGATSGQVLKWDGSAWVAATDGGADGNGIYSGSGNISEYTTVTIDPANELLFTDGSFKIQINSDEPRYFIGNSDEQAGVIFNPGSGLNFNVSGSNVFQLNATADAQFSVGLNDNALFKIADNKTVQTGLEYNDEYLPILTNDRSIPDVGLVKELITDSLSTISSDALGTGFVDGGGSGSIPDGTVAETKGFTLKESLESGYNPDGFLSQIRFGGVYNSLTGAFIPTPGWATITAGDPETSARFGQFYFNGEEKTIVIEDVNLDDNVLTRAELNQGTTTISSKSFSETVSLQIDATGSYFNDGRTIKKGLEYGADYSTAIKANARSIPDVGTVRQIIADSVGNSGHIIREEGSNLTARPYLNFVGAAATAADNSGANSTDVSFDDDLNALAGLSSTGFVVRTAANTYANRTITAPVDGIGILNGAGSSNPIIFCNKDLAGIENANGIGFAVRTTTDTWDMRTLTAPAAGLTISNTQGISGDPSFALANDLAALEGLSSTGIAVRTGTDTWAQRTVTAGNNIVITNGNGVSGNPTIAATSGTIFTQTAGATVTNTTTETSILGTGVGSKTLASGFFTAGKTVRLKVSGLYSTVAIPGNVIVRVKLGSTVIASATTSAFVTGASSDYFDFETTITCRTTGGSGTVMSNGIVSYAGATGPVFDAVNNGGSTATVATNASQVLDVTVEWDGADAGKVIKTTTCVIEGLN